MKTIFLKSLARDQIVQLCQRPAVDLQKILPRVQQILEGVKSQGDEAVRKWTKKFDGVDIDRFRATEAQGSWTSHVQQDVKRALRTVAKNIKKFHRAQWLKERPVLTMPGVKCWRETRPIERVGLYIPRGLVSTVLMLGIPAKIAGCKDIIMCTPPSWRDDEAEDGPRSIDRGPSSAMLLAAKIAGITKIFNIGGAQAIAAMAYGTESVPKVDKIFGPGNQYVTAAKLLVSIDPDGAAIDLPAGPSEVLVIADEAANPALVAADLLSQAEHGPDSQVVLASVSPDLVKEVKIALKGQVLELPEKRRSPASHTLENSFCLIAGSINKAIDFANQYAPEHLILNIKNPAKYIAKIKNAGSVFVGEHSPESAGDYASGTNHVLPTSGWAKSYGGVSVDSFIKKLTFQKLSKAGLKNISKTIETLANIEQMPAHKKTITLRQRNEEHRHKKDIELIYQLKENWRPESIKVERVKEGETNKNYRVGVKQDIWFVRIPYEVDIIDRKTEGANILALKDSPQLAKVLPNYHIYFLGGRDILGSSWLKQGKAVMQDGIMVTDYIKGRKLDAELLKKEQIQEQLVRTLWTFHNSGVKFVNNYDPFQHEILKYKKSGLNPFQLINRQELTEVEKAERVAEKGLPKEMQAISTHNDLIFSNLFLGEGNKIYLLDWEYAGLNIRGIHYDFGSLLGENLFHKKPLAIKTYKEILQKACQIYGKNFDTSKAYYGALANVIVTFWWGLAHYSKAPTAERREYFREYVPKRIQGIKFLTDIIKKGL